VANKFVWSGATGANDGSSWDNAYTTLMKDWGAEGTFTPATDYIYVRSVHSETSGTTLTITGSTAEGTTAACRVICVVGDTTGTTPGNLATGAAVNTNVATANIAVEESLYVYGVHFFSNNDIQIGATATDQNITLEVCRLELTGTSSGDVIQYGVSGISTGSTVTLFNVTHDFNHASQIIRPRMSNLYWIGGAIDYDINNISTLEGFGGEIVISGVDLSAMTDSALFTTNLVASQRLITVSRCLLASGATIVSDTIDVPGFRIESYHCQIGTDADPSYQMEIQDARGKVSANTAKYRTGGASDGVRSTPISWDVDTTVGSVRGYPGHAFECPPISAWTDGDGSTQHTYRVAFASDATINDDELWIELEGPNDAATNSLAALKTTRVAPRTTAAAYTTDSGSTWTGTGVGTKQYMQVQYTPDKPGPVTVRVMMAKASDNIYVDPKIQIDPA
jgi:hypothetical protein